jgi:hypothetical protein
MRELDPERAKLAGCVLVSVGLRQRLKPTFLGPPRPTVWRRTDHAARQ